MTNHFPNADTVSGVKDPLQWNPEKCRTMISACREMAQFHGDNNPAIKKIYRKYGFSAASLKQEEDLARIPMIGVAAMKQYLLTTLTQDQAVLKLTSSGTRGQKTQIWFDQASLDRVQMMLARLWEQEGLVSDKPANYLMFVYDPKDAKDLGIAFSDKNQQRFAPVAESFYAIQKTPPSGQWEFRTEECLAQLKAYARSNRPARLFGIPSFVYDLLQELKKEGPIELPPESWVVVGGGWKAAEDKKVSREYFRSQITELLGIPDENIRDGYGMAEHSAPYLDCRRHKFHIPVYNRIYVRDPESMELLPPGETGLLELITPYNAMMPNLAILSTDLGYIDPDPCECGYNAPVFALVGRGGTAKHKGCAITASEIVKR